MVVVRGRRAAVGGDRRWAGDQRRTVGELIAIEPQHRECAERSEAGQRAAQRIAAELDALERVELGDGRRRQVAVERGIGERERKKVARLGARGKRRARLGVRLCSKRRTVGRGAIEAVEQRADRRLDRLLERRLFRHRLRRADNNERESYKRPRHSKRVCKEVNGAAARKSPARTLFFRGASFVQETKVFADAHGWFAGACAHPASSKVIQE